MDIKEEEKEDGELEEGELEDEDEGEKVDGSPRPGGTPPYAKEEKEEKKNGESNKADGAEGKTQVAAAKDGNLAEPRDEEALKKERKEGKEDSKRKHREDDDEKDKRKKKKRKRKHASSDEEDEEIPAPPPKFSHRKVVPHPHAFGDEMGFDAMLQQEMYLRGRSPPPGMVTYGPPGPFGHPMFRDYDSFDSGSDSEMRMDHRRRRRHRRSRSRSPSRKNEAICMYYMQGSCQRGKACPYSHDIQPQRKMELCKFYMMDCCAKREKCLYMHKDFPCKYYHTGVKCKSADKCKFSHEPMSDATRGILLKHIELAPKDILGDFPRLTKEAANMVVSITEAHRSGNPMDVENMPGIMDLRDRGFKYVDKAIRNVIKRQARAKSMEDEDGGNSMDKMKHDGKMGDSRRHCDMGEDKMSKMYGKHDHISPSKHHDESRVNLDRNVENLVKAFRNQSYDKGMRNQPHHGSPEDWRHRGGHDGGDWMGGKSDERGPSSSQYKNMVNGEVPPVRGSPITPNTSSCSESMTSPNSNNMGAGGDHGPGNAMQHPSPGKKLGGMMACMPQKQRDFFQRIQQQHSVQDDDDVMDNNPDDAGPGTSNMNWYSSDEEGDGPSPSKPSWQNPSHNTIMSPSRTPPGSRTPPMGGGRFTPPGKKEDGSNTPPMSQSQAKNPFPNINLDNIKITDLAFVLSAVKNQVAAKNSMEDSGRDPRGPASRRDLDTSRDNGDSSRYQRDTRDSNQRSDNMYPSNSWGRNSWDSQGPLDRPGDSRDSQGGFLSPKRQDSDQDQRQRMSDTDLRVLPRAEGRREDLGGKSLRCDTDMRMSNESSIYDVDLRQLNVLKGLGDSDESTSPLPFKVPVHTPAKEIVASLSSHSPMYYHLIKVTIPKPDFSHLKINRDDPRIMDDPRLRRMLRRNSTEDSANKSPRAPSRYEMDGPFSPTGFQGSRNEQRFNEADSRDPRVASSRDPRGEPRVDPRAEARPEPRVDPRTNVRVDPRVGSRGDPRTESRDPRADQMNDMRNQDPRMGGMYGGGGNNMGMMEGGMQYQNMGPGPGPGPGPMGGPPLTRVDPRGRPGLLGPAPVPFSGNVPPPSPNVGPGMPPPYMMGQMGPNSGYYPEDQGDMMGGGKFPQGGSNWGGPMPSNDPRFHRDMGDGPHSYTPPPVS